MAGLLDALLGSDGAQGGGGLLDFLRANAFNQQPISGLASDQAQYSSPLISALAQAPAARAMPPAPMPSAQPTAMPAAPMPMPVPAPAAPAISGAQPLMAPETAPSGFSGALGGFLQNLHTGPIGAMIGAAGGAAGLQAAPDRKAIASANATANFLRSYGVPEADIAAAVGDGRVPGNGEILKVLMANNVKDKQDYRPATAAERKAANIPEGQPLFIEANTNKPLFGPANTSINNVINGEKEQDKVIGKGYGERYNEIQKAGTSAPMALGTLNLMDKLISDPNFYSGTGGTAATTMKRLAVSAGIAGADTAAPNELFQKLSQKSVLDAAGGSLGTGFSNADRDFINGTVANVNNTPEGNKQIIDIGRQVHQRNIEIARQAREYAKAHNGRLDSGFDDQVADYADKNPLFAKSAPAATTPSQKPAAAPAIPQPGEIRGGYRFKGGHPGDKSNWEQIS